MVHAKMRLVGGKLEILQPGAVKLVDKVDEITFSGKRALESGRSIFYVTNVGAFKLTPRGLQLIRVVPGVNIKRDILEPAQNRVVLPESGDVPLVNESVMTGKGFRLELRA